LGAAGSLFATLSVIIAHLFASNKVPYIFLLLIDGAIVHGVLGGKLKIASSAVLGH